MRCSQPYGLPSKAQKYLQDHAIREDVCLSCGRDSGYRTRKIGAVGMFDDVPLLVYYLKGGGVATESVQIEEWSSGPMIWCQLETPEGIIKWSRSELLACGELTIEDLDTYGIDKEPPDER